MCTQSWRWLGLIFLSGAGFVQAAPVPIKVKVVLVAMFEIGADTGDRPGEFQFWVEREHLTRTWAFPQGERPVRSTEDGAVLGLVTGIGTIHSAASIMALGLDPRFDLTQAYWIVAGIAGGDPHTTSLGSACWAEWVVDGDLGHEIDAREMPPGWSTGHLPLRKFEPYAEPRESQEGQVFHLNPALVAWAYHLTKDVALPDSPGLRQHRALYTGFAAALLPPRVQRGDTLSAMNFWHGERLNAWAEAWVRYQTGGQGTFATSAMEDTGTLQSITWLARAARADAGRVLVLRTVSNYSMQWPGATAIASLSGEGLHAGYSAYLPALEAAYQVGSPVLHALLAGWGTLATVPPAAP